MDEYRPPVQNPNPPRYTPDNGKTEAITSLVLGIVALCFCVSGGVIALALGITGLVFASMARKKGYQDGMRTGGFVTSLLAVIFGSISALIGLIVRSVVVAFGAGILTEIFDFLLWL